MATTLDEYKAVLEAHDMSWDALDPKQQARITSFLPYSDVVPDSVALVVNWSEFWS